MKGGGCNVIVSILKAIDFLNFTLNTKLYNLKYTAGTRTKAGKLKVLVTKYAVNPFERKGSVSKLSPRLRLGSKGLTDLVSKT